MIQQSMGFLMIQLLLKHGNNGFNKVCRKKTLKDVGLDASLRCGTTNNLGVPPFLHPACGFGFLMGTKDEPEI